MGGTSGAIYGIFLSALALHLSRISSSSSSVSTATTSTSGILARACVAALDDLCGYTTARQGHRTLMDSLIPFVATYGRSASFAEALCAAEQGMQATGTMHAVLGRASYVDAGIIDKRRFPDPGALGVVSILKGIENSLREQSAS
jgi:triose/dihydroxyacetone kinase / FAD-AMP lyase (cyclizing)